MLKDGPLGALRNLVPCRERAGESGGKSGHRRARHRKRVGAEGQRVAQAG